MFMMFFLLAWHALFVYLSAAKLGMEYYVETIVDSFQLFIDLGVQTQN